MEFKLEAQGSTPLRIRKWVFYQFGEEGFKRILFAKATVRILSVKTIVKLLFVKATVKIIFAKAIVKIHVANSTTRILFATFPAETHRQRERERET